ncbi:MAG: type II toxin-antitoxin system prevent-host-death family antitoxin [marine benthic group bacterium]|nr:type II toxin-antitoxin system prevent-host-death family antitoxin [Candidatus Benthicola marisminoris]
MITTGHLMTMNDRVGVAELKARLSEYLRRVRRGETITILDRETEIARIFPLESADPLSVRPPSGRVSRIQEVPLPAPLDSEVDVLELLREERQVER